MDGATVWYEAGASWEVQNKVRCCLSLSGITKHKLQSGLQMAATCSKLGFAKRVQAANQG